VSIVRFADDTLETFFSGPECPLALRLSSPKSPKILVDKPTFELLIS
jgi:hypothetical protein